MQASPRVCVVRILPGLRQSSVVARVAVPGENVWKEPTNNDLGILDVNNILNVRGKHSKLQSLFGFASILTFQNRTLFFLSILAPWFATVQILFNWIQTFLSVDLELGLAEPRDLHHHIQRLLGWSGLD